jgi:hypothetical protein
MTESVRIFVTQCAKKLSTESTENWYSHIPKSICEHEDLTVLWNQEVQTDRAVLASRPDLLIKKKKNKVFLLK